MGRIQYFEIEDLHWFPSFLRDPMTDFLQFVSNKMNVYQSVIPVMDDILKKNKEQHIIDLASGGGGGLIRVVEELQKTNPELKITLTDFYPNIEAFKRTKVRNPRFEYLEQPVDARAVPSELKGFRTMFLSFHHFAPKDATAILTDAVNKKQPIGIFEVQDRSFASIFAMLLSPLSFLFTAPFIKPFRWSRIIFTYLIPILPLLVLHDGIVSALRTYHPEELDKLIAAVPGNDSFDWKTERIKSKSGIVIYLTGTPKDSE